MKPRDQQQELGELDPQQRLEAAQLAGRNLEILKCKVSQRLGGGFGFHAPRSLRASSAFWSRCSGPIDEASSGEISLDDVLGAGGRVVEGKGLES